MKYADEFQTAQEIAVKAGKLLKELSSKSVKVKLKGAVDLVTEADLASEKLVLEEINKRFPNHAVLSEEAGRNKIDSENLWIIDPLDGTTNYAHGFPIYAVSIGFAYRNEVVIGAVYDPNLNELFLSQKGGGATLNGKPIRVSAVEDIDKSLLATGFPYNLRQQPEPSSDYFKAFTLKAQGVRRAGAASLDLCNVACGRLDGFWEVGLKPWDTAAGSLILTEAGGKLSKYDGSSFDMWTPEVVATNGLIHEQMTEILT